MEKICRNCEFYWRYVCQVPLYEEGHYVGSRPVRETDSCSLFEPAKENEK